MFKLTYSKTKVPLFGKSPELNKCIKETEDNNSQQDDYNQTTIFDWRSKHIPGIDFSKQLQRTPLSRTRIKQFNLTIANESFIKRRVHGVIPLSKQLSRKSSLQTHFVQDYRLKHDLVYPKVQTKVFYAKEIRTIRNKSSNRKPLILPMSIGPPRKNSFFL